jgi:hypothetical protein
MTSGGADEFTKRTAVAIANAINRRRFLQRSAVAASSGLAASVGLSTRAEARHNYSVRSGCGPISYNPNGCGSDFGCGPSDPCAPAYCDGTHCINGHSVRTVCDGYNCWTWTITCGSCGSGGQAYYRWTCCDCTCGNPDGPNCTAHSYGNTCICGTREYLGCLV